MRSSVLSQVKENAAAVTYTIPQVMMTLAQLAATSPNERPSGESVEQQETRIFNAINSQLANADLATEAAWQAIWVGLTQDRANLAYIAQNTSQNAFAVCLRGTQFNSIIDLLEDIEVGSVTQFTAGPAYSEPILVSQGAMEAFTEVINAYYIPNRTNLLQALTILLENAPSNPTLYVTGHSLGGAMATMIALYLYAQSWTNTPTFAVYTFAAPTAGLQAFANCFDSVFGNVSQRYYNAWDVVPNAWVETDLSNMQNTFYPSVVSKTQGPGPAQNLGVNQLIAQFMEMPGANVYVQTNQNGTSIEVNSNYSETENVTYDASFVNPTTADFLGQAGFQHNNYLALLPGSSPAPAIPSLVPTINSNSAIFPNAGPSMGGIAVTISGANFTSDCVVDFGTIPAAQVTFVSASQLTAVSPPLAGTVDVRVTNSFGTSAIIPLDQFTAPPPAFAPAVTAISPTSGPAEGGYTVTIVGTGFTSDCSVFFGDTPALLDQTIIMSLTEINVPPPTSGSGTVAVTVTTTGNPGSGNTPTFTFGPPVITGVSPSFGLLGKNADNPQVTITGVGFGSSQGNGTVQFVTSSGASSPQSILSWTDTKIVVMPPNVQGLKNTVSDITVTNSAGLASDEIPADQYTYYNSAGLQS